jgi:hypothetical protein
MPPACHNYLLYGNTEIPLLECLQWHALEKIKELVTWGGGGHRPALPARLYSLSVLFKEHISTYTRKCN